MSQQSSPRSRDNNSSDRRGSLIGSGTYGAPSSPARNKAATSPKMSSIHESGTKSQPLSPNRKITAPSPRTSFTSGTPQPLVSKYVPPKLSSRDLRDRSPSPVLDEEDEEDDYPNATNNTGTSQFFTTAMSGLSPQPVLPPPRPLLATPQRTTTTTTTAPANSATAMAASTAAGSISRFAGTSLANLSNFDSVMARIRTEADALREHEAEQLKLQGTLQESRNLLIKKSQDEIAILQLSLAEQKETYEAKLREQSMLHDERVQKVVKEYELKLSMHGEADKARLEAKEAKIKHKYEQKLRDYEGLVSSAMESCKQRELTSSGVIMESRHELSQAKLAAEARERALRDELRIKDNRLSDIQQKLQTFHDVQKYGKIWKNNAINVSYAYLQLCATSTIKTEVEKDNFTQYLSSFDRIFENMAANEEASLMNEVCVNKKAMKKLLRQAKVSMSACYVVVFWWFTHNFAVWIPHIKLSVHVYMS
jgi:hypothetical protein